MYPAIAPESLSTANWIYRLVSKSVLEFQKKCLNYIITGSYQLGKSLGYRPLRWHRTTGHSQGDLGPSWQPWKIILKETKYFVVKQSAPWKIIVKKRIRKKKYFDLVKKITSPPK